MKYLYHATDIRNLSSILRFGLKRNEYGMIYLADTEIDALKFVALRMIKEIAIIKVNIVELDQEKLIESNDHNYDFFKCKAWEYRNDISKTALKAYSVYKNPLLTIKEE